jgi:tRNA (mo5U34)-methyltransferase
MTLQSYGAMLDPDDEISATIKALAPWFHNLHLPGDRQTAPDHPLGDFPAYKWAQIESHLPRDLSGSRALDIGCNAGFYTFELATRGADVTAIDVDGHYLEQARWAAGVFGLHDRVSFRRMPVYQVTDLPGKYDIVLFLGVFYHLRYPLLALDLVAQKVHHTLIFQSLTMPGQGVSAAPEDLPIGDRARLLEDGWPKMAYIERALAGDYTNRWVPNHAGIEAMLRAAGLEITARPGHEIYLARPTDEDMLSLVRSELDVVFGRKLKSGQLPRTMDSTPPSTT